MKKVALVLFTTVLLTACGSREAMPFDQFAQCMSSKGIKMYGSDTCPHCQAQKAAFKGSFDQIKYIECNAHPDECQKADITAYPTWEINGKKTSGTKSLSELSELSGCALTVQPSDKPTDTQS